MAQLVKGLPDGVLLSFHNRGSSIPPEKQAEIFQALTQGQAPQDTHGAGHLGLYIAKKIILAHGGQMDVSSSEQAGTEFTVRLPRK